MTLQSINEPVKAQRQHHAAKERPAVPHRLRSHDRQLQVEAGDQPGADTPDPAP